MKLIDAEVPIKDIFLDPFNPRFIFQDNLNQMNLLQKIFKTRDAKELLTSMALNVKWVNKIVVINKENLNKPQREIIEIDNCKYLVVEGNNRLACLKSGKVSGYNEETAIPVLIAEKDKSESDEDFAAQIRITQGIANVMVVKEWSLISKARHLYQMYKDIYVRNSIDKLKPHDVYRRISQELGIGVAEVRESIIRYEFYKTIAEISDSIPEDHWGYLEAFDRTKDLREKFGMSQDTNLIDFNNDQDGFIEEILKEIPTLIKKAATEGINSKQFRDIIDSVFKEINEHEDIYEKLNEITKVDSDFNFRVHLEKKKMPSETDYWKLEIEKITETLEKFPPFAPWASDFRDELEELKNLIIKHLATFK
jgi:hypothetical protein